MSSPPNQAAPLLSARQLSRQIQGQTLWQGVGLDVSAGDRVMIVGPSGSGKSLLMRQLAALDPLQTGEVLFRNQPQEGWAMPAYRSQVMYLQQRAVVSGATVREALKAPFALRQHAAKRFDPEVARALLVSMGKGPDFLDHAAEQLSGGETQLVALTRALLLEPTLLLLDEAASALDPDTSGRVEEVLRRWSEEGERTWIAVSHDPAWRERLGTQRLNIEQFIPRRQP